MKSHRLEAILSLVAVTLLAVFMRMIPHIPNVSPIGALALFSGFIIPHWIGFLIPLFAMGISDIFLGFHSTIPFVYGSFILIALMGFLLRKKLSPITVVGGSLSGSLLFFVITNFGVWLTTSLYEKSFSGLLRCYQMGLPFFRNTLFGDLFYTALFFLGFRLIRLLIVLMLPSIQKIERQFGNTV